MLDITDWTAAVLQMDVKTTGCYAVMEASNWTLRTASGEFISLLLGLLLQLSFSVASNL